MIFYMINYLRLGGVWSLVRIQSPRLRVNRVGKRFYVFRLFFCTCKKLFRSFNVSLLGNENGFRHNESGVGGLQMRFRFH